MTPVTLVPELDEWESQTASKLLECASGAHFCDFGMLEDMTFGKPRRFMQADVGGSNPEKAKATTGAKALLVSVVTRPWKGRSSTLAQTAQLLNQWKTGLEEKFGQVTASIFALHL